LSSRQKMSRSLSINGVSMRHKSQGWRIWAKVRVQSDSY